MVTDTALIYPSLDLSIPELLDFHYKHNPDYPVFVYAEDGSDHITRISFLEFVRGSQRAAKAILGDRAPSTQREVVGIMAHVDTIVYHALVVGLMKAGFTPFPISPRNSPSAVINLLQKASAHRLLVTRSTLHELVQNVESELSSTHPTYAVSIAEVPSLVEIYPKLGKETVEDPFIPLPVSKTNHADIGMYLHSSGSTGFPKAIPLTFIALKDYASIAHADAARQGPITRQGTMSLPPFHAMALFAQILSALYTPLSTAVFPPVVSDPGALPIMPTPENILPYVERVHCDSLSIAPAFLQVWAQSPESIAKLRSLKVVASISGGGPLAPATGDYLVSQGVRVRSMYGGTEFGAPSILRPEPADDKDWNYIQFSDRVQIHWEPQGDGTFECQFLANASHSLAVENLPDVRGYATADIFEPHPTRKGLWKIVGRADDVLIHSSGEKTVPGPMEAIISSSFLIQGAVMFGRQRDQAGILIEPSFGHEVDVNDPEQISKFRNMIWPIIEEANKIAPNFSRIFKETILIASSDKPCARVAKGTISKKATLKLYEKEIDSLYATLESNAGSESVTPPKSWTVSDLREWLTEQACDILSGPPVSGSADIFEQGFDSLAATVFRLRITSALRKAKNSTVRGVAQQIHQTTVYSYPTIDSLARFIIGLITGMNTEKNHEDAIEEMIAKYSQGLDKPIADARDTDQPQETVVLLTGSTGNLGAQMLESLLRKDSVARVYTLNRPSTRKSMLQRHEERFHDKALDAGLLSSEKLVFLEGDTAQPSLGLSANMIEELREHLTMVIHNAWRLDFNLSLSSFESNVRGSRNLIDLVRSSRCTSSIRFLFTSSIGSTQSWDSLTKGPYPEEVVTDPKYAVGAGYGESKYVVERILAKSGLQATSFRIGQVTGGKPNGAWATTDWFPIIVKSSVALGILPNAHGVISWLPMDAVSDAILDVGAAEQPPLAVNVVHPRPVPWQSMIEAVRDTLIREKELPDDALRLVSFQDWVSELEKQAVNPSEQTIKGIPGIKLLDFLRSVSAADKAIGLSVKSRTVEGAGLNTLSTVNVQRLSQRMRNLELLDQHLAELWVKYWIKSGL